MKVYTDRVEELYFKLCNASTLNKSPDRAEVIRDELRQSTLRVYIRGLLGPLRSAVKAKDPSSIEAAKQIARREEIELGAEKAHWLRSSGQNNVNSLNNSNMNNFSRGNDFRNNPQRNNNFSRNNNNIARTNTNNYPRGNNFQNNFRRDNNGFQRNNNNFPNDSQRNINNSPRNNNNFQRANGNAGIRPNINSNNMVSRNTGNNNSQRQVQCYNCNGNHYASQCRNKNYSPNSGRYNNANNFARPPANYNVKFCSCHENDGHNDDKSQEYERENFNVENSNSSNVNSGNGESSSEDYRVRSINQTPVGSYDA